MNPFSSSRFRRADGVLAASSHRFDNAESRVQSGGLAHRHTRLDSEQGDDAIRREQLNFQWYPRDRKKGLPNRATGAWRRCAGTRTQRGAGVQSNRASIARRRREGAGPMRRRPAERPRRVRVGRPHAQGVGRCRGEDGASACPAPDSEEFRRASHRRVPLGPLVCFVSASRWHGM